MHDPDFRAPSFRLTLDDETGRDLTIRLDEATTYVLDGEPCSMESAVQDGYAATVTHRGQLALKVEADSLESSSNR